MLDKVLNKAALIDEVRTAGAEDEENEDEMEMQTGVKKKIIERESEYQKRRFSRMISPERADPFAMDGTPDGQSRSYADIIQEQQLTSEKAELLAKIQKGDLVRVSNDDDSSSDNSGKRRVSPPSEMEKPVSTATTASRWDATPQHVSSSSTSSTLVSSSWDDDGSQPKTKRKKSRWDETPVHASSTKRRSRWDETPVMNGGMDGLSTSAETPNFATISAPFMATPTAEEMASYQQTPGGSYQQEFDERNRPLTDEELDMLMPSDGYKILEPPASYQPIHTPSRRLYATPTPMSGGEFNIQLEGKDAATSGQLGMTTLSDESLPALKPEDEQHFAKLMQDVDEAELDADQRKERIIMKLLLRIKNGTPPMRKTAMRQISDNARSYGPGPLFNQILPLLMSPSLEDQERHLLVKVIDRVLYKLDDLVRPYVHKILVVIEPLLIDEDYYARIEGREIISNLAKASGLPTMISVMRPDLDNIDEYVRNVTARAFAVVASALGIPSLLPFLKAVCRSKKSWQARHTGIKIVHQMGILMGCAVLPHLKGLVSIIKDGLKDQETKVRTMTALALAALAEAAAPYGIESFDEVLMPLWQGIRQYQHKTLAAFLKAIGYIIPLMDPDAAFYYTQEVVVILTRHFQATDDEMKKIVLKVVKQCVATDGVTPTYIRDEIIEPFFKHFWNVRMALDRRNYKQLVETTVDIEQGWSIRYYQAISRGSQG
eukprot:m.134017 g.134017  ORF g.134017 m.134017 type:complete len:717 (-) comp9497_c0_seq2:1796-3946(-)